MKILFSVEKISISKTNKCTVNIKWEHDYEVRKENKLNLLFNAPAGIY